MNVLVINGSPKGERSNTMKLVRAFLDGAGCGDAKTIDVTNINIEPCTGCFSCWNKTPGTCVIRDEMSEVLAGLIAADIIVWAFPLYYFSVPGKMKPPRSKLRGILYQTLSSRTASVVVMLAVCTHFLCPGSSHTR